MSKSLPPQFKKFDLSNARTAGGNRGGVSIQMSTSGAFALSAELVQLMGVKAKGGVSFLYDDTQEQWYICKDDKEGLPLRADTKGRLQCSSSVVRRKITDTLPEGQERGRIPVASEPTKVAGHVLWPLLTSGIVQMRYKKEA